MEFNGSAGIWICLKKLIRECACAVISFFFSVATLESYSVFTSLACGSKCQSYINSFCYCWRGICYMEDKIKVEISCSKVWMRRI